MTAAAAAESNGKFNLAEARRLTPPLSASIADGLRMAAVEAITEEDVSDIIRAQVAKAKGGDSTAARFVLEFLGKSSTGAGAGAGAGAGTGAGRPIVMKPAKLAKAEDDTARKILELLATKGPMKPRAIAETLGLPDLAVAKLIEGHKWFDVQRLGVHLTQEGWNEVKSQAKDDED
jgi:hypothetical protein